MIKKSIVFISAVVCFILLGLAGCKDDPPPNNEPVKVVKQKIPAVEAAKSVKTAVSEKVGNTNTLSTINAKADESKQDGKESELVRETREIMTSYDPKGRFDPFEPLFKEQKNEQPSVKKQSDREKRIPKTPLEKIALSQLKLSAIIRATSGNKALVVDATGKGYVVEKGTYIGLNSGRVIQIEPERIVIEEDIEDIMGELKIRNSELKLQKPPGEF